MVREIAALLREATGESEEWSATITGATLIDDDLRLESIELVALAELLERRYGPGVDLLGHLAGLDLDGIIAFSVADLVRLVRQR